MEPYNSPTIRPAWPTPPVMPGRHPLSFRAAGEESGPARGAEIPPPAQARGWDDKAGRHADVQTPGAASPNWTMSIDTESREKSVPSVPVISVSRWLHQER
ncbi:MAG: hypothetical protein OHK0044_24730 [Burkholderiaceae bacterium]